MRESYDNAKIGRKIIEKVGFVFFVSFIMSCLLVLCKNNEKAGVNRLA